MKLEHVAPELEKIMESAAKWGRVQAIFGDPITLETRTIVPVGAIMSGFGAGGGGLPFVASGLGGGGDLRVVPVGFLYEDHGHVAFQAIDLPPSLLRRKEAPASKGVADRIRKALQKSHE
jgi:uncharacterized spore protein YtfJ